MALYALGAYLRVLHEFSSDSSSLAESLRNYLGEHALDMDAARTESIGALHKDLEAGAAAEGIDDSHPFAKTTGILRRGAVKIADHVGSLPGRKNLVWISGSFPFSIETNNLQKTPDGRKIPFATDVELPRSGEQGEVDVFRWMRARLLDAARSSERVVERRTRHGKYRGHAKRGAAHGRNCFLQANAIKT